MNAMAQVAVAQPLLIVEDDPSVRRVLKMVMGHAGLTAEVVESGTEALARLESGGFAGVLLDLGLPDGRSNDVLEWLHAHGDQPPWLVISAMDRTEATRMDSTIAPRFISKPFDPWKLIERVRGMIDEQDGGRK